MKVGVKLRLLLIFVVVSIFLLTAYLRSAISSETQKLLESKLTETREKEAPRILNLNTAYLKNYIVDYTLWDQMRDFALGKKNNAWADEEIKSALSNYRVDYIWVLDSNARMIYHYKASEKEPSSALHIAETALKADLSVNRNKSFFVKHHHNLAEVFAGGITHTSDKDRIQRPAGYLLIGRKVDSEYIDNLKSLSPEINFSLVDFSGIREEQVNAKKGEISYSIPIKGFDNAVLGAFNVSRSYPVLSKYQSYLSKYLLIFIGFILALGFIFFLLSEKLFLRPLKYISQAFRQANAGVLNSYFNKNDEFGSLSNLMNSFFTQNKELALEIETRKKSEAELVKALAEKDTAQTEKSKVEELLEQQQAILQLNTQNADLCFTDAINGIIELGAKSVKCERVGVWIYNEDVSSIRATHLYNLSKNTFEPGDVAFEADYPAYFRYLKKDEPIIANDALKHPATYEFGKDYLPEVGITSMMDIPIHSGKKVIGVVCYEHIGPKREWTENEQVFARTLANLVALNYEREQRKNAEEKLTRNHKRFEETQELAQVGSWEVNLLTREVSWSKEMYRIFDMEGVPQNEIFDKYFKKIHPDDRQKMNEALINLISKGATSSVETRLITAKGDIKYIQAIADTIKSVNGHKVITIRGAVQDITKQKQAAMAKSDFLSCMSHEIRTPINGVIGIANLLEGEELNERQKEYVKTLNFSANHLSTVVSDILDFSKIESGYMTFEKVSFNLEQNCRYVFDLFANKANEKDIVYGFVPSHTDAYSLYGDYVRLNQVLSNLISNAIKFTEKGNVVFSYDIKEETQDKVTVEFKVKDSGIGIPAANQINIFDSFTQANDGITRKYGGTGLGLTISKRLVELQGGKISLNSAPGLGSEFIVELTFDKHVYKNEINNSGDVMEKTTLTDLKGMNILVAEDNKVNAMVLTRFLKKWNANCQLAKDGEEAVKMAGEDNYDIVLMDIQMPNMDGIEATRMIRKSDNERLRNLPVVAFTADASVDTHRELLKIGFNHCITKPFNPDLLFTFLRKRSKSKLQYSSI